jgi:uncharacterized protein HemX
MAALTITLAVLLAAAIAVIAVGYRYMRKLMDRSTELLEANQEYDEWMQTFSENVQEIYDEMVEVDNSGAFRADDEIGHTFDRLKELVDKLKSLA